MVLVVPTALIGETRATTQDGRVVLLYPDGSWKEAPGDTASSTEGFREAQWGAPPEQVKKLEKAELDQDASRSDLLVYRDTVGGLPAQ